MIYSFALQIFAKLQKRRKDTKYVSHSMSLDNELHINRGFCRLIIRLFANNCFLNQLVFRTRIFLPLEMFRVILFNVFTKKPSIVIKDIDEQSSETKPS